MGKRDKKPNRRRHKGEFSNDGEDFYDQHPSAALSVVDEDEENSEEEEGNDELQPSSDLPSKFLLYQQSVQVNTLDDKANDFLLYVRNFMVCSLLSLTESYYVCSGANYVFVSFLDNC